MQLAMNNDYDHVLFSVIGVIDFFGLDGNTKIYVLPTYHSLHYFFQLQNYRQSVLYVRVSQSVIIYQSCVILSLQPQSSQEMVIQSSLLLKTRKGGREGNFDITLMRKARYCRFVLLIIPYHTYTDYFQLFRF